MSLEITKKENDRHKAVLLIKKNISATAFVNLIGSNEIILLDHFLQRHRFTVRKEILYITCNTNYVGKEKSVCLFVSE